MLDSKLLGIYSEGVSQQCLDELSWLKLPLLEKPAIEFDAGFFVLNVSSKAISLQATGSKAPGPIFVEFASGKNRHRRIYGGGSGQLIAKAVGIKPGIRPGILDLTAGLGEDGFALAALGCRVNLLERSPIVFTLLADGLKRARQFSDPDLNEVLERIECQHIDARQYLTRPVEQQVIYFDPMFPKQAKQAAVNKAMSSFQELLGGDCDAGEVLALALASEPCRVVVKRPRKGLRVDEQFPELDLPKPGLVLSGKSSRYDVYPLRAIS